FANPPWHEARSTPSALPRRRRAKQQAEGGLHAWVAALSRVVRPGGTITLIVPTRSAAAIGPHLSLVPKPGRAPKLALLRLGTQFRAAEITLHEEDGRFTPEIEAVLRQGAALPV